QLINGFMGFRASGKVLARREQLKYDMIFILVGLVGVISVVTLGYRGTRQERAHFSILTGNAYSNYYNSNHALIPYSWFLIDQPLSFIVNLKNVGNGSAYHVLVRAKSFLKPDMDISSQREAINDFQIWLKSQPTFSNDTVP